jgi:hypothetical protein
MPAEPITHGWGRRALTVTIGLLAAVGLWSLLQQVFPSGPCHGGTGTEWVTIGNQGLDLCRIVSWQDHDKYTLVVSVHAGGAATQLVFEGKDREALLPLLPRGQAR